MVNCIDNEKLLRNIITQFCDQNFKFTLNLKILGSIHVQVDNNEVLTCLLDEKFFKSSQNRSLITTNQNLFNPLSVVKPLSENNTALNLVTTLNQLQQQQQQQQQQQLKLVNPSHLAPTVKTQSLSSSSSTSSKSSTSSYMSGDSKHHKRKRSNDQKSDDGCSSSSASCRSRRENHTDDEEEDDGNSSDHNENENEPENEDNLNDSNQTPVKRNKREEIETHDEAAAAAASALSLISAAAVANKIYNQQNIQPVQTHNFHSITAHLNPYQAYSNNNENEPGPSAHAGSSALPISNPPVSQKPLKPKSKFIDYEQQLKQQIFQQSIENQTFAQNVETEAKKTEVKAEEVDQDSSLEENQLYMDEDNMNKNDKENEEQKPQQMSHLSMPQENHTHLQQQQQQHLMMAAAAAALMNNNSVNQPVNNDNSNLKLFMPHSLALNLAAVKQQQAQQIQQLQNGEKTGKKKPKNTTNLTSPSANLVPINGPNSNKSTGSTTSCSSSSSTSSNGKQSKKSRQTIAALAAAAAAARNTGPAPANPLTPANQNVDLQRNLVALANQFGLKDSSNIDQIINEVTEKSKNAVNTPKPNASKHLKKQHLLSASVQNSPNSPNLPKKEKIKKTKAGHFVDSSNIMNQNPMQNGAPMNVIPPVVMPNPTVQPPAQQSANPAQAAAAAAAVALQYHHFMNNNLGKNINSATPQKPNPKFHLANGGYVEETENQMRHPIKYEDADEEEPCEDEEIKEGQNTHLNGPLSVKSMTGPLMPNNTNTPGQGPNGSNLEFECTACEKKFKYYCYYKRHMDACHSDMPKYICDTCNKSYKWEASFRQHLRSHHTNGQSGLNNEENGECGDGEENNENREMNESGDEMKGNGRHEDDEDEEEPETRDQNRMHQNENRNLYYERDHEQIGAAGTLASIAESLNGMHGRLIINNQHMS